nr:RNA-directed DNA polymerase, eukaryota, reverse transcriptase zinc-binding domain protein [Tanacetum cinerariifolium]
MMWHRRLGHLNFKTMNKLVKNNLVKGLPSKCFANDHTCVACLKGKHHKASCKTKLVNSVSKPLHTLHMDLFEPTSVSSLKHKWYCLVVTDDFFRQRFHANVSRFQRPLLNNSSTQFIHNGEKRNFINEDKKDSGQNDNSNSYAHVVKGRSHVNREADSNHVLVLDDSCVNQHDYSYCLNGKVKDFGSLSNLKVVLRNEGFDDIELRYLGGLWVMIEFKSVEVKNKFRSNVGTGSWFSHLFQASNDFILYGRATSPELDSGFFDQNDEDSESEDEQFVGDFKEDIGRSDEDLEGGKQSKCSSCDSVGNSGRILYVWDPNLFVKLSASVSNYFVILRGIVLDSSMQLSYMFYADDAVFVGQWSNLNIDIIVHVLKCFHRASSLSINMSKSKITGIARNEERVEQVAFRIGCDVLKVETLLKSVLGSMPIYHMCIFKVPMKVLQHMESIQCHFFNGVDLDSKKLIWVKWNNVLTYKEKGGLGCLARKYGVETYIYPGLYALELNKKVDVAAKLAQPSLACSFRRVPRSGVEQSHLVDLLANIEGVSLVDMNDRWTRALEGSRDFSVASVRKLLDDKRLPIVSSQTHWIKAVPIKVNIHAWKVRLDSLPTRLNISRRGMDIASILCPIYGIAVESSSHVFFGCHVAKDNF